MSESTKTASACLSIKHVSHEKDWAKENESQKHPILEVQGAQQFTAIQLKEGVFVVGRFLVAKKDKFLGERNLIHIRVQ